MSTKTFEQVLEENGTLFYKSCGVSMLPLIREGRDFIVIRKRPAERLKRLDVALFRRPGVVGRGAYVLHRVLRVNPNGTYWIVGDNCTCGETVREEQIIGVLSAVVRRGKTIPEHHLAYRMYAHLWCDAYPLRFFALRGISLCRRAASKTLRILGIRRRKNA